MKRVERTKAEAKQTYDSMACWYDLSAVFEAPYRREGLRLFSPGSGERLLDIGCGTGETLVELARAVGDSGEVFGIDISPAMVSCAREKLERRGVKNRTNVVIGDASRLPFDTSVFDGIFLSFTLELFDTPEIPVVLHECKRVLKPKGRCCVVALSRKKITAVVRVYEFLHDLFPARLDCRPIPVREMLTESSFHVIETSLFSMYGLPVEVVSAKIERRRTMSIDDSEKR